MDAARYERAESIVGHRFADPGLLVTALTHPSYAAEHDRSESYDRLEFLGDAVLGFVVAEHVYRRHPEHAEGVLTAMKHHVVAGDALAEAARRLGLGELVLLGVGAGSAGDRRKSSVLENTMEAVIGALYLDAGLEPARDFVLRALSTRLSETPAPEADAKGALQRLTQGRLRQLPHYRIVQAEGPIHDRVFTAEVAVDGEVVATGTGRSKQAAEKAAAAAALERLGAGDAPLPG